MGKKKFTAFCGIEKLITTFKNILTVPYTEPDESTPKLPILFFQDPF